MSCSDPASKRNHISSTQLPRAHTHHASVQHICARRVRRVCVVVSIVHIRHRAAVAGDVALQKEARHEKDSAPASTNCTHKTWKPHACRAVAVKMSAFAHDGTPFTELYEHMMPLALPRCTQDWNAGK